MDMPTFASKFDAIGAACANGFRVYLDSGLLFAERQGWRVGRFQLAEGKGRFTWLRVQ